MLNLVDDNKDFIEQQILEATEEYLQESINELFDIYPLLESIKWSQYESNDDNINYIDLDNILINEGSYHGNWKLLVENEVRWTLESLDIEDLQKLYGINISIIISRNGVEVEKIYLTE